MAFAIGVEVINMKTVRRKSKRAAVTHQEG
jgi:hypothetical protein